MQSSEQSESEDAGGNQAEERAFVRPGARLCELPSRLAPLAEQKEKEKHLISLFFCLTLLRF